MSVSFEDQETENIHPAIEEHQRNSSIWISCQQNQLEPDSPETSDPSPNIGPIKDRRCESTDHRNSIKNFRMLCWIWIPQLQSCCRPLLCSEVLGYKIWQQRILWVHRAGILIHQKTLQQNRELCEPSILEVQLEKNVYRTIRLFSN